MKRDPTIRIDCRDGVYKPAEDSELLLASIDPETGQRILEVGTGSGFVALHCAAAGAEVISTDIDPEAVACARENASANGLNLEVAVCDLAGALKGPFDLVLFNPPYLPGRMGQKAADGGLGGVEVAAALLDDADRVLAPGGCFVIVLSSHSDIGALRKKFRSLSFQKILTKSLFFETLYSYRINSTKRHRYINLSTNI